MKKDIETIDKNQKEMKNTLEGIKSRLDEAKDRISEMEDKVERNTQSEQQNEQRLNKNKETLRELQYNMKHNICIIGISEREEKEQGIENMFEKIMTENFPDLVREKVTQVKKHRGSQWRWTQSGLLQDTS